jgi:MFS family permease
LGRLRDNLGESAAAFRRVLQNPGLRRLNLAWAGSIIGDWAFAIVVSIYAFEQGGATAVGLLGVVRYLLMALIGPVMASFSDRYERRHVMLAADAARGIVVGTAAICIAAGTPALVVYSLAVTTVVLSTAFRPAQSALLPALATEPADLTAANVVSSTIESVGFFAGPAIAALLLAFTTNAVVLAFDAATFVWSFTLLLGLHVNDRRAELGGENGPMLREMLAGFSAIARDRDLRLVTSLFWAQCVVAGAALVFEVTIALDVLHLGESGVGLLSAVSGIGGIVGGGVALGLTVRKRLSIDFGTGVLLWSAPLLLLAAKPTVATAVFAVFCIGLGNSLVDINGYTIVQRVAPEAAMGRVFGALESALVAGMAVGALAMPVFISAWGVRTGLVIIGGSVSAVVLLGIPGLNRIDHTTLEPAKLPLIEANEILAPLPGNAQERLARALVEVRAAAGDVILREGDAGDHYFIVEQGTVAVSTAGATVNKLGPGDAFGEIALLRDVPRQATVTAVDDVVLQSLDRATFLAAVTRHGEAEDSANSVISRFLAV